MKPAPTLRAMSALAGSALVAVGLTMTATVPARAATRASQVVTYRGHHFTVPASWPVIRLAAHPGTCVRFNRHAVYLGTPAANQHCPSQELGRTGALLVQPAPARDPSRATEDRVDHQITATRPGLAATATYTSSATSATRILTGAGFPRPRPRTAARAAPRAVSPAATAAVASSTTNYTGEAFDPCTAPSSSAMSAWKSSSPYGAIGIYVGGVNEGCSQPDLTAGWVSAQAAAGWHFYLLYVGPQAPGTSCSGCSTITSPVSQAASTAQDAASEAASLGFGTGTPIVYDMEAYSSSGTSTALTFISDWTKDLHALGYESGEYSSASSGISDLVNNIGSYTMPDVIDIADWNGDATTSDSYVPSGAWDHDQRIHQYSGGVNQTYGGYEINVDQDYMDVNGVAAAGETASMHLDALNNGALSDDIRYSGGSWQGWRTWKMPSGTITAQTAATTPDGSLHLDIVAGGTLYDDVRYASGDWQSQGWATPGQPSGTITAIASAGLPSGALHLDVVAGGKLYDAVREPDGSWTGWSEPPQPPGTITRLAAAALPNGTMYLAAVAGGTLYDLADSSGGSWGSWTQTPQPSGTITALAAAGLTSDSLHLDVVAGGTFYDNAYAGGAWQSIGWSTPGTDPSGTITALSVTGLSDGTMHVDIVAGGLVYDNVRSAAGHTWQGWDKPSQPGGTVTRLSSASF
jgi:Domain of unknown function (DUF1906)